MAESLTLVGVLVGAENRSYREFETPDGIVPAGTTRWLHISTDFGAEPARVKVRNAHAGAFEALALCGFGTRVRLVCSLYARGNQIERQYAGHEVVATADGERVASGNGKR